MRWGIRALAGADCSRAMSSSAVGRWNMFMSRHWLIMSAHHAPAFASTSWKSAPLGLSEAGWTCSQPCPCSDLASSAAAITRMQMPEQQSMVGMQG